MKILIVVDSNFSQKVIASYVSKYITQAVIISACNGEEGLKIYKEEKPDYLLTDLLMPKMGGQELIHRVKDFDTKAKIIVISADVQNNVREEMESCQILAFISKPFTEEKGKIIGNIIRENING